MTDATVAAPAPTSRARPRTFRPLERAASEELWPYREYRAVRDELMLRFFHLVEYHAARVHVRLPEEVQVEDLVSAGVFGLMEAIAAYDAGRGVKFATYCAPRIRGAMLDELRAMDWVPRLVRTRAARLGGAVAQLEVELGRPPTADEVARRLKVSMSELEKIAKDGAAVGLVSLSRKWFETDGGNKDVRAIDVLADPRADGPIVGLQRDDLVGLLCRGLSRAERMIVVLYYFEDMTMKEIGRVLDLSESRVSQLHTAILLRLRVAARDHELEEAAA